MNLDSKLIYISAEAYLRKVNWVNQGASEWVYFGAGDEVKPDFVKESIASFFSNDDLYVAFTRQGSFETNKNEVFNRTFYLLGKEDFSVWSTDFLNVINFNKIGVLRFGKIYS